MEKDRTLPLHDEAAAREEWRGGEAMIGRGERQDLPASEVDNAAPAGEREAGATPRLDLRPPD
jgi:hypothetical protein